jgi:hypothetical protein
MNKKEAGEKLVLAIFPTTRGLGFVAFEGPRRVIDWGVKEVRTNKNRESLAKASGLVEWYKPDVVLLEDTEASGSRRSGRIRQLHRKLIELVKSARIELTEFSRFQVKAAFVSREAKTRYEIAKCIAIECPVLAPWLPSPRKLWDGEDPSLSIFDAAALAITFFEKPTLNR